MKFRPCIDIHNGQVKQIVGSSLRDEGDQAKENFISQKDAVWYAALYKERCLTGGHMILLNPQTPPTMRQMWPRPVRPFWPIRAVSRQAAA